MWHFGRKLERWNGPTKRATQEHGRLLGWFDLQRLEQVTEICWKLQKIDIYPTSPRKLESLGTPDRLLKLDCLG